MTQTLYKKNLLDVFIFLDRENSSVYIKSISSPALLSIQGNDLV